MRFDAYTATIRDQTIRNVALSLGDSMQGYVVKGKPMPRYRETLSIDVDGRMAAWVGVNADSGDIFVEGKGETTPRLAQSIRVNFPVHSVPRVDVCEDFDEPGVFETLQELIRATKGPRVKGGYVALPDDVQDGRTWSAGVRGGVAYLRLYEAGKHPDRVHMNRPNWVRPELECRPHYSRDKAAAARMSPLEIWGFTAWSQAVGQAITKSEIPRFEPEIRRYSFDQTTRYIANTFRRHLEEMRADGLDIARTFQAVWEEEDEYKKLARNRTH